MSRGRGPCSLLAGALLLSAPAPIRGQDPEPGPEAAVRAVQLAQARCAWDELATLSRELRDRSSPGDAGWWFAGARLGGALHTLWTQDAREELIGVARETLALDAEWRRRRGDSQLTARGDDDPDFTFELARLRTMLADALHSEGLPVEALGHRRLAIADLSRLSSRHASIFHAQARLSEAGDLLALGRLDQARARLTALRDEQPRSAQTSVATALLALSAGPLAGYRGDFLGDPRLELGAQDLRRALPEARRRVAAWIGGSPESLATVAVGIADPEEGHESWSAFLQHLPRCPALPPVVVVHAHELVLGPADLQQLLVHELSHAALNRELGTRFERLPNWVQEGLACSLAGQLERLTDTVLAIPLHQNARAFLRASVLEGFRFQLDLGPCSSRAYAGDQLAAGLALEEHCGGRGAPRLVEALLAGKDLAEAVRAACGQELEELAESARRLARSRLEERWREVVPGVREVERLALESPQIFLATAGALGLDGPELVREHALRRRAQLLETAGDLEQAAAAWREVLELRGPGADARRLAQLSEVRCLLPGAGEDEARELLERLHREALLTETRAWAATQRSARAGAVPGGGPR